MTKIIPLNDGHTTVDDEDYEFLMQWHWKWKKGYVVCHKHYKQLWIHRVIVERYETIKEGLYIDHRDRNTRNNTRANLRICTIGQNSYNQKGAGGASPYKGVNRDRTWWQARIRADRQRIYLGCFSNEIDAAKAYDAAARIYHGEFAYLNFPESE